VVIGGQTLALLLTLIGIPVAYRTFDDISGGRVFAWLRSRLPARSSREPSEAGAPSRRSGLA
jgi:hypothetical protein